MIKELTDLRNNIIKDNIVKKFNRYISFILNECESFNSETITVFRLNELIIQQESEIYFNNSYENIEEFKNKLSVLQEEYDKFKNDFSENDILDVIDTNIKNKTKDIIQNHLNTFTNSEKDLKVVSIFDSRVNSKNRVKLIEKNISIIDNLYSEIICSFNFFIVGKYQELDMTPNVDFSVEIKEILDNWGNEENYSKLKNIFTHICNDISMCSYVLTEYTDYLNMIEQAIIDLTEVFINNEIYLFIEE